MSDQAWRRFIDKLTFQRVDFIGGNSDDPDQGRETTTDIDSADVVSSNRSDLPGVHAVLLDIDVPAWLIPSSTEGHSHLYADVTCSWSAYLEFLHAAAKIGLVEPGYVDSVETRGYSSVRLPWVRKDGAA